MTIKQDSHQEAVEEFEDARDDMKEQYDRMRADLRFSNPTDPKQWDKEALKLRSGRPCLTFDRTNQFIANVVNGARQNKPGIHVLPANSEASVDVAEQLTGIIRHVEYVSRAAMAYDTSIDHAARCGLGWLRVVPEIMRPETNEQEIRIKRIADPLSCYLQAGWMEPDGSDAMVGFIETMMPKKAFEKQWPKAATESWEETSAGWFDDKQIRICERLKIIETKTKTIVISMQGQTKNLSEEEYWALCKQIGFNIPISGHAEGVKRSVTWSKLSGVEVLEETEFPSRYLGLIPVVGHDLMVDGKRHLGGMTRQLMDGQRAYNYERSAFIESVSMQPKAPYMVPFAGIEGFEGPWGSLDKGNPAFLPYNHLDEAGNPIPTPTRINPPAFPAAFAQGGQIATQDMESAVGIFHANLGAPGQAVSGRAKREDKVAGDTANFHYPDNQARSIEQLGRVVVDMIPRIFDTARQARIMGEDGEQDFVHVDPNMPQAVAKRGKKVIAINPSVGAYDVRVKSGPAYTTMREEQTEQLGNIMQANPALSPILADLWVQAQDWPGAEIARKRLAAMLPPQIQEMEADEGEDISPAAAAKIKELTDAKAELEHALQAAHAEHMQLEGETKARGSVEQMKAGFASQEAQAQREHDANMERMKTDNAMRLHGAQLEADRMKAEHAAKMAAIAAEQSDHAKVTMQAMKDDTTLAVAKMDNAVALITQHVQAAQADKQASDKMTADKQTATEKKPSGESQSTANVAAQLKPLIDALTKAQGPKKSSLKIVRQADGSYIGERIEA